MPKPDRGAFSRRVFTSVGDTTTFSVVERHVDTQVRPFHESLDTGSRHDSQPDRGERGKKKRKIIKKKSKLHSGTFIASSKFEEVKRHREVCDA
jgi:hypothetical protein